MDPVRLLIVVALIGAVILAGRWWQSRDGEVKDVRDDDGRFDPDQLAAVGIAAERTGPVALLMGSPSCAPCKTVKRVLGEVAADRPDFSWVDVDAGDHLGIAEDHHVLRVPTLFVVDPDGRILARTSGVPARRDLERVLDERDDLELVGR